MSDIQPAHLTLMRTLMGIASCQAGGRLTELLWDHADGLITAAEKLPDAEKRIAELEAAGDALYALVHVAPTDSPDKWPSEHEINAAERRWERLKGGAK